MTRSNPTHQLTDPTQPNPLQVEKKFGPTRLNPIQLTIELTLADIITVLLLLIVICQIGGKIKFN